MDYTVVNINTYVLASYVSIVLVFLGVMWGIRRMIRLVNRS